MLYIVLTAIILFYILSAILQMRKDRKHIKETFEYYNNPKPDSMYSILQEAKRKQAELDKEAAAIDLYADCRTESQEGVIE